MKLYVCSKIAVDQYPAALLISECTCIVSVTYYISKQNSHINSSLFLLIFHGQVTKVHGPAIVYSPQFDKHAKMEQNTYRQYIEIMSDLRRTEGSYGGSSFLIHDALCFVEILGRPSYTEDTNSRFFYNSGTNLTNYMVSNPISP
jgi:hypothetical protein